MQQAEPVDAAPQVEAVDPQAAKEEGKGGGKGLVLVRRNQRLGSAYRDRTESIVQNATRGTLFRGIRHYRLPQKSAIMLDSAGLRAGLFWFLDKRLPRHGAARYNRRLSPSSTIFLEILWSLFV
jgi:hypothetical protein